MSHIRRNDVTGEYVCISESRKHRPMHIAGGGRQCPFCPENAGMTPDSVYETDNVRSFLNLYPILGESGSEGYGRHEVLVDTKRHGELFHDFDDGHATETLFAIFDRIAFFYRDNAVKYVQVFKNQGQNAGATIAHSHWQIIGMPFVPFYQAAMLENAESGCDCAICGAYAKRELVVYENETAFAFCPSGARFGHEVNVAPKRHFSTYGALSDSETRDLAGALARVASAVYGNCAKDYNICFQMLFNKRSGLHFFIQIIPRKGRLGGFELSTYSFTHSDYPEDYSTMFRNAIAKDVRL